jgi:hypothetical protein
MTDADRPTAIIAMITASGPKASFRVADSRSVAYRGYGTATGEE